MAPLQLDHDGFTGETVEERLGVHGHGSHSEAGVWGSETTSVWLEMQSLQSQPS